MTKKQADRRLATINRLRESLKVGDRVYTICVHATRTGATRSYVVLHTESDGTVHNISGPTALALGRKFDTVHGGVKTQETGHSLANELSYQLHGWEGSGKSEGWDIPTAGAFRAGFSLQHCEL